MGIIRQKSDRDKVRAQISAGGWEVAWGDLINEGDILTAVISGFTGGAAIPAWVEQQIQVQMLKFGKSLNDVSPGIREQAKNKVQEIVKKAMRGEWNIGGLGVKAGVATYHRYWKGPFGGWQNLWPNHYQPYIAFRMTSAPTGTGDAADSIEITEVPGSLADSGPTQAPPEPPPSPIGTYEDINLGLTDDELKSLLEREGQKLLDPTAHT
jgi:hypothetical protein